ncbi:MAG: ABC transporter substrate-binding protein, partial [Moraxellaceae bacterium]
MLIRAFLISGSIALSIVLPISVVADTNQLKAQRIASINLCADALLLKLVDSNRINSLYYLSANPQFSAFAQQAQKYHLNHGLAEEIVPRNPDLIVAGEFSSADAKILLTQLGFHVEVLPLPRTLADITTHIRLFGRLTGTV